jgi:acyl-CoA synthetase (NDP forming)
MKEFFSPRSIAVLGASEKNQWFVDIVDYARRLSFAGGLFPVNPGRPEVCGVPALKSVAELPDGVDFAAVILRSSQVMPALGELASRGIRNVLLVSSGFAETGSEGARLQKELADFCRERDILLLGPNCLGFINVGEGRAVFAGGAVEGDLVPGSVGIIGQSGAGSEVITTRMLNKGLGISLYVTTGNEAVLTTEDCLEYLIEDGVTRVAAMFVEGFRDVERLKALAGRAASKRMPIVVIKVGRSTKGVKAAASHTGALAGDDAIVDAFLRQHGIIRVNTIEELVETTALFARYPLPGGGRLALSTLSGGLAGLYADICQDLGIELPDFTDATMRALAQVLPPFASPANPLDVTGSGFLEGMERIVRILMDDENIDIILTLSFAPASELDIFAVDFNERWMRQAQGSKKPVIPLVFRGMGAYAGRYYGMKGHSFIDHARDGLKALAHVIRYADFIRAR